ncbi:MAG: flagellar hook-basal body protein [Gemmatimonadota bacterium]|nr:flagellar hook-basal body protein [Gemmatimonadota bacterium]MDH5758219.1 flagellar hook-basal body protein [Gemmatimonadota bacterium]
MGPEGVGGRTLHALRYWERRQEAVANNLANVSTPGFKGERVFAELLEGVGPVARGHTDTRAGTLSPTGRPLDVAFEADGFLVVDAPGGDRFIRGGSLRIDEAGTLVTLDGHPLLDERREPVVLPEGNVEIAEDGQVSVNGSRIARLRVEVAGDPGELRREGANLWIPPGSREVVRPEAVRLRQGHLEESNVDPVSAMVEMLEIQRAYGAIQRSVQVGDQVMQTISTELGRVGG